MLEELNIVLECLQKQQYYSGMLSLICTCIPKKKSKLSYQCVNASVIVYMYNQFSSESFFWERNEIRFIIFILSVLLFKFMFEYQKAYSLIYKHSLIFAVSLLIFKGSVIELILIKLLPFWIIFLFACLVLSCLLFLGITGKMTYFCFTLKFDFYPKERYKYMIC